MVLAFCRRGSVIPICLYLLVGRYMKERISGLRNEREKTKRTGLFQRITAAFPLPLIISYTKKYLPLSYQISLYSGT
nr:succinate dehydrogenase subunit 4 [Scutellaria tsinyunensis]